MKRAFWLMAALALLLGGVGQVKAGSAGPVLGTYNTANTLPFMANDSGTSSGTSIEYQQVYAAWAFSGPINIRSLGFFFASQFGGNPAILSGNYKISFSTASTTYTPVDILSPNLADNIGTPLQTFYSGTSISGMSPNGSLEYTINGTTPYLYDPSQGNLLMDIYVTNQADEPDPFTQGSMQADRSGEVMSRAYAIANLGNGRDTIGLVTQFNPTPEPASLTLLSLGALSLVGYGWRRRKQAVA
jgi:hypothetical protein